MGRGKLLILKIFKILLRFNFSDLIFETAHGILISILSRYSKFYIIITQVMILNLKMIYLMFK